MDELIVVIVNQGFEEEVMEAARTGGARGGTIFNARGTANAQDEVQFLGIKLHPDKEVVFILTEGVNRNSIMDAIKQSTGLTTPGAGIMFSLPVDSVMGIGKMPNSENDESDNSSDALETETPKN